jgi:hypothetical protein
MSKPKSLQKRENIQSVVVHLFAQNGYHAIFIRAIARELVMNQSTGKHL